MLVLASASPRRLQLLEEAGLDPIVDPADIDERLDPSMELTDALQQVALAKATAVASRHADATVLAADTIGELDGEPLGKPADEADAKRMLTALSGRTHRVHTAVAVLAPGHTPRTKVVSTIVTFREIDESSIDAYIATGEPMGKAGAYAIQAGGARLVERIEGSWSNVVGLPVVETLDLLAEVGPS